MPLLRRIVGHHPDSSVVVPAELAFDVLDHGRLAKGVVNAPMPSTIRADDSDCRQSFLDRGHVGVEALWFRVNVVVV